MKKSAIALICLLALAVRSGWAQTPGPRQDQESLRQTVEQFLRTQGAGLPGHMAVKVGSIDPRLNLAACPAPEAFLPNGSRAWGKTTVGVRCIAPTPWTIYVQATVQIFADYVVVAVPLAQGKSIGPNDIVSIKGDLTALPAGIITDPLQAIGRTLTMSLPSGTPLRQDALRSQQVVQQGQIIRLVSSGQGFRISTEARALSSAAEGQIAQARTPAGQVISGVAKTGGVVEVAY